MASRLLKPAWWGEVVRRPARLYALLLCGFGFAVLASWPIVLTDTDLWFHLSRGRYLFAHQIIPHDTFFSFISPPREYVNYSWLFQALVYALHAHAGYYGLIAFRSVLFLATFLLLARYLLWEVPPRQLTWWRAFVFALVWLVLLPRYQSVRPFLTDYFFMVVFLVVLDRHRRWALILPAVAVLWANLHGIYYPFLLLITGAYGLEYFWDRVRGRGYSPHTERRVLVPLVLSMVAVFLTPHGARLLRRPFYPLGYLTNLISELQPITLGPELFSFETVTLAPTFLTVERVAVLVILFAVVVSCVGRQVRISHLLMGVIGIALVTRGHRFMAECALLALPLLANVPLTQPDRGTRRMPRPVARVLVGLLMGVPVIFAARVFEQRPAYPFSQRGLPEGIVTFLHHVGVGGNVLNHPNTGGYLEWRLYPEYRIATEMAIFTDDDLYTAKHMFLEREPLRKMLSRYDPSFITVPLAVLGMFRDALEGFPQYVMVFFDDVEVLYLNRDHHPALAQVYELKTLDPLHLGKEGPDTVAVADDAEAMLPEATRLMAIYSNGGSLNHLLAVRSTRDGAYEKARMHAERIIATYPEYSDGYRLKGDALKGLGLSDQALSAYTIALRRLNPTDRREIYKQMGLIHLGERRYASAYQFLAKGIDVFSPTATLEELYQFSVAARLAGKDRVAEALLTYLHELKVAPDDRGWIDRVKGDLAQLGVSLED